MGEWFIKVNTYFFIAHLAQGKGTSRGSQGSCDVLISQRKKNRKLQIFLERFDKVFVKFDTTGIYL